MTVIPQLYLPSSPVCCYQEPIPFHVTVFANQLILDRFAEYRPMPSSFLPLSSSTLNLTYEAVQNQLSSRKAANKCPLRLKVQRLTLVDAQNAGFSFASFYPRSRHEAVRSLVKREEVVPDRSYMYSAQSIGHGVVHSANRNANSVVWSGAIIIPPTGPDFCGSFEASGVQVVVSAHTLDSFVAALRDRTGRLGLAFQASLLRMVETQRSAIESAIRSLSYLVQAITFLNVSLTGSWPVPFTGSRL